MPSPARKQPRLEDEIGEVVRRLTEYEVRIAASLKDLAALNGLGDCDDGEESSDSTDESSSASESGDSDDAPAYYGMVELTPDSKVAALFGSLGAVMQTPLAVVAKRLHASESSSPTVAIDARDNKTVPLGEALEGIRVEYERALLDLAAPTRLQKTYFGAPVEIRNLKFDVIACIRGQFFKKHFVVCVKCVATFGPQSRGGRGGDMSGVKDVITFESMHFVKENCHLPEIGTRGSFELQSVSIPGKPYDLQCVAGVMTQLGLIIAALHWNVSSVKGGSDEGEFPPRTTFPDGPIGVLGMGGNVVGNCLVHAMPDRRIVIVDVEPSVCECCEVMGTFKAVDGLVSFEAGDVVAKLQAFPKDIGFFLLFLDCFDPLVGAMMHAVKLLQHCRSRLMTGGVLVVNAHIDINDPNALLPFVAVFGSGRVHAVNIRGCKQAMIACIHDADEDRDSPSFSATMHHFRRVCDDINANLPQLLHGFQLDPTICNTFSSMCFTADRNGGAAKNGTMQIVPKVKARRQIMTDDDVVARVWIADDIRQLHTVPIYLS